MSTPRRTDRLSAGPRRRVATGAVLAALAVTVAGCGQPTPSSPDDGVAPTVSVPIQPTVVPDTTGPTATDDPSAAGDGGLFDASTSLTDVTCKPGPGEVWSLTGTLRNPDSEKHVFTVAVFVVTPADGNEVASEEVDVALDAGASAPVSVKSFWTGPAAGHECLTGVTVKDQ